MARIPLRARGPTDDTFRRSKTLLAVLALTSCAGGCVSYEPDPVDVAEVLAGLETQILRRDDAADGPSAEGESRPERLASFAVTHNPSLKAARARIGVAQALLVEAGLLSDPEIGWDAMDALASQIVEGSTSTIDVLSGLGLWFPLPRPGELDAKTGAARWRAEETRRLVMAAEWHLVRDVHVACEIVRETRELLEQNQELIHLAERTRDYFDRAKAAGGATAIEANLASGDVLAIRARRLRLQARLRSDRQHLNALLGLPPSSDVPFAFDQENAADLELADPAALVASALRRRPDLAVLLASYEAAEEDLRLEVARQFPMITIGTGITLVPGVFTHFNRPAIDTATARREALRQEIEAQVHEVRRDVHHALAAFDASREEVGYLEAELLPNAERSLRLTAEAFAAGEVTLLEILSLQRVLVDARTRTTEARAELRRRRWQLLSASGRLLAPHDDRIRHDQPEDEEGGGR